MDVFEEMHRSNLLEMLESQDKGLNVLKQKKKRCTRSTGEEIPANTAAAGHELNTRSFRFVLGR
jgi:hypothetical protein